MTFDEDQGATQVYSQDDPVMGEWSVNISDDETRTMPAHEVAYEYMQGRLDANDTFVWRDGMADWVPLGQCAELMQIARQYAADAGPASSGYGAQSYDHDDATQARGFGYAPSSAPAPSSPAPAYRAPSSQAPGYRAPSSQAPGYRAPSSRAPAYQPPSSQAPAYQPPSNPVPAYQPPPSFDPPAPAPPDEDLFDIAAAAPPPSRPLPGPASRRVGQRNEESSLFSIEALQKAKQARESERPQGKPDLDDIFNLGGLGGGIADAFAPPPIHAPAPPPPPPPPKPQPVIAPAMPASSPASMAPSLYAAPPKQSNRVVVIGIAAAAVLLAGAALGSYIALSGDDAPGESRTEAAVKDEGKEEKKEEDAKDEEKQAKTDDESKDEDGKDKADEDDKDKADESKEKTADEKDDDSATHKTAEVPTKADDKKRSEAKRAAKKKEEEKKAEPAGEFNVNAARSALTGAANNASGCKKPGGPTGKGRAAVTFANSGRATQAIIGPPFGGTSVGNCVAQIFKRATVPPFSGSPVTVQKTFFIK